MLRNALGPGSIGLGFRDSTLSAFRYLLGRLTIFGDAPSAPEDRGGARTAACQKKRRQRLARNSDRRSRIWAEEE